MMRQEAKKAGKVLLRVLFPVAAMKRTKDLVLQDVERNRENLAYLRELMKHARARVKKASKEEVGRGSFDEAISNRREGALSIADLQVAFVRRKRWALFAGLFFLVTALYGMVAGGTSGNAKQLLLSAGSAVVALPLFFLIALSAQHRLWQLKNRRLSVEEKGGLSDFQRETPFWLLVVLNPSRRASKEIGHD